MPILFPSSCAELFASFFDKLEWGLIFFFVSPSGSSKTHSDWKDKPLSNVLVHDNSNTHYPCLSVLIACFGLGLQEGLSSYFWLPPSGCFQAFMTSEFKVAKFSTMLDRSADANMAV